MSLSVLPSNIMSLYVHPAQGDAGDSICSTHDECMQDVAQTPVADTIDLASMSVEDSYDGPHLEGVLPWTSLVLPLLLT
jgi:hypothetical protein